MTCRSPKPPSRRMSPLSCASLACRTARRRCFWPSRSALPASCTPRDKAHRLTRYRLSREEGRAMDQVALGGSDRSWTQGIVRTAFAAVTDAAPLAQLHATLGGDARAFELIILFVTPEAETAPLIAEAKRVFAPARVIGCTTAGELTDTGYREGGI